MNKKGDSLGDRIKKYEDVYRNYLTPRSNVILRIDGKAFHTFTRGFDKPYDKKLIDTLRETMLVISKQISGFKLAYLQSDEISIWINDRDTIQTQGWFDYNINKLCSITASMFTAYFNKIGEYNKLAMFDCRAFVIPEDDISNYFLWRQKDWYRNSIQMYARSMFSQKQLHGKGIKDMFDMFYDKGVDWESLDDVYKNGTFITKDGDILYDIRPNFESISTLVNNYLLPTK